MKHPRELSYGPTSRPTFQLDTPGDEGQAVKVNFKRLHNMDRHCLKQLPASLLLPERSPSPCTYHQAPT